MTTNVIAPNALGDGVISGGVLMNNGVAVSSTIFNVLSGRFRNPASSALNALDPRALASGIKRVGVLITTLPASGEMCGCGPVVNSSITGGGLCCWATGSGASVSLYIGKPTTGTSNVSNGFISNITLTTDTTLWIEVNDNTLEVKIGYQVGAGAITWGATIVYDGAGGRPTYVNGNYGGVTLQSKFGEFSSTARYGAITTIDSATAPMYLSDVLRNAAGTVQANLSGLSWAFFKERAPGAIVTAPIASGSALATNGSGAYQINITSAAAANGMALGDYGYLIISNSDGTNASSAGESAHARRCQITAS